MIERARDKEKEESKASGLVSGLLIGEKKEGY